MNQSLIKLRARVEKVLRIQMRVVSRATDMSDMHRVAPPERSGVQL